MWVGVVSAIVGVLVGAFATVGTTWILTRRAERRTWRAATRLLAMEMYRVQAIIAPIRESGRLGPEKGPLTVDSFDRHALALAQDLSFGLWKQVEGTVLGVRRLDGILAESHQSRKEFSPQDLADFERIGAFLDSTVSELVRVTRGRQSVGTVAGWVRAVLERRSVKKRTEL